MRSTPLYAPDGMAGGNGDTRRLALDSVQGHERHDDGLVHNHNWAKSADFDGVARSDETFFTRTLTGSTEAARSHDYGSRHTHERYDDGLVHNHDWAVTGK